METQKYPKWDVDAIFHPDCEVYTLWSGRCGSVKQLVPKYVDTSLIIALKGVTSNYPHTCTNIMVFPMMFPMAAWCMWFNHSIIPYAEGTERRCVVHLHIRSDMQLWFVKVLCNMCMTGEGKQVGYIFICHVCGIVDGQAII